MSETLRNAPQATIIGGLLCRYSAMHDRLATDLADGLAGIWEMVEGGRLTPTVESPA